MGLAAGVGAERLLEAAFPSGETGLDTTTLGLLAPVVVLAVTFLAPYVPARRASRLDPMQALRYE